MRPAISEDLYEVRVVDLFCGCGGFSLGAHDAGCQVATAYDTDKRLTFSYERNFPGTRLRLRDVAELTGDEVVRCAGGGRVDGIFGGPPCQGFSEIGRRCADDPRRLLLRHFFRLVAEVQPAFFIMENVRGLAYADVRHLLDEALDLVADRYAILGPLILDAAHFGAATNRRRLFVIGIHKDRGEALCLADIERKYVPAMTVRAAIFDLATAVRVGLDVDGFDIWRLTQRGRPTRYAARMRDPSGMVTSHARTLHAPAVANRFAALSPGTVDRVGRHYKLNWPGQCPTLRAGTGSDRGSFQSVRPIHPDEPRVITVREAARLQGFPDRHRFHPTVWHSFRMIGNSVSPIAARAIFEAVTAKVAVPGSMAVAAE